MVLRFCSCFVRQKKRGIRDVDQQEKSESETPVLLSDLLTYASFLGLPPSEYFSLSIDALFDVLEGLKQRLERNEEGIIAHLIRQNSYLMLISNPYIKTNLKPHNETDIFKFSRDIENQPKIASKEEYLNALNDIKQHG